MPRAVSDDEKNEKVALVLKYKNSGLPVPSACKKAGVPVNSYYKWKQQGYGMNKRKTDYEPGVAGTLQELLDRRAELIAEVEEIDEKLAKAEKALAS